MPLLPSPDEGQGGERGQVCQTQCLGRSPLPGFRQLNAWLLEWCLTVADERLVRTAAELALLLQDASKREISYDLPEEVFSRELAVKQERHAEMKTTMARFSFQKSLESFDFKFQPSIDPKVIRELATGCFIADSDNVLLLGPPGVRAPQAKGKIERRIRDHRHGLDPRCPRVGQPGTVAGLVGWAGHAGCSASPVGRRHTLRPGNLVTVGVALTRKGRCRLPSNRQCRIGSDPGNVIHTSSRWIRTCFL